MNRLDYSVCSYANDNYRFIKLSNNKMNLVNSTVHLEYLLDLKELNHCTM